jgi:hypothetical protein
MADHQPHTLALTIWDAIFKTMDTYEPLQRLIRQISLQLEPGLLTTYDFEKNKNEFYMTVIWFDEKDPNDELYELRIIQTQNVYGDYDDEYGFCKKNMKFKWTKNIDDLIKNII